VAHLAEGKFLPNDGGGGDDGDDDDYNNNNNNNNNNNTHFRFLPHVTSCVYIQNTTLLKNEIRTVQEMFIAGIIQNT